MNKTRLWLVLRREYLSIVAKKSFILTTLLVPFLIVSIGFAMGLMMVLNEAEGDHVAVIDQSGRYGACLENTSEYIFEMPSDYNVGNMRQKFANDEESDDYDRPPYYAIVVIPATLDSTLQVNVFSSSPTRSSLREVIEDQLSKAVSDTRVASYGIPELDRIIKDSQVQVAVRTNTWSDDGDTSVTSDELMSVIGLALAFLTYMFVLTYGAMIMSSVVEDKVNRIVEVIVSSCKPVELMLGKILGVALVGLTQVAIWAVLIGIGLMVLGGWALPVPWMPRRLMPVLSGDRRYGGRQRAWRYDSCYSWGEVVRNCLACSSYTLLADICFMRRFLPHSARRLTSRAMPISL